MNSSVYMRRCDAAEYIVAKWGLPCACRTLAKLAVVGGGPVYRRAGRIPLYKADDLDAWALSKIGSPQTNSAQTRGEAP